MPTIHRPNAWRALLASLLAAVLLVSACGNSDDDDEGASTDEPTVTTEADDEVARYASLLLTGTYAAEYLRIGLVED